MFGYILGQLVRLKAESLIDLICMHVSKYRLLESRLEETVQQTMKIREEKISSLEKKLEESKTLNATLRSELATVRTFSHFIYSMVCNDKRQQ